MEENGSNTQVEKKPNISVCCSYGLYLKESNSGYSMRGT